MSIMECVLNLNISDMIQVINIICSSVLSIISVIIAVKALSQGSKALKESTRPYITISYEVINTLNPNAFFLIKNYGHTAATIVDFKYDIDDKYPDIESQFSKVVGTYFAPGQKKLYLFDASSLSQDEINFDITYKCGKEIYKEHIPLKIKLGAISSRSKGDDAISFSLQEIAERLL